MHPSARLLSAIFRSTAWPACRHHSWGAAIMGTYTIVNEVTIPPPVSIGLAWHTAKGPGQDEGSRGEEVQVLHRYCCAKRGQPVAGARDAWRICSTAESMLPTPEALGLNADQDLREVHDQTQRNSLCIGCQQKCNVPSGEIANLQNRMHSSGE